MFQSVGGRLYIVEAAIYNRQHKQQQYHIEKDYVQNILSSSLYKFYRTGTDFNCC